jgi:hypothetical protein
MIVAIKLGSQKEERMFFFEKKNQKTFVPGALLGKGP